MHEYHWVSSYQSNWHNHNEYLKKQEWEGKRYKVVKQHKFLKTENHLPNFGNDFRDMPRMKSSRLHRCHNEQLNKEKINVKKKKNWTFWIVEINWTFWIIKLTCINGNVFGQKSISSISNRYYIQSLVRHRAHNFFGSLKLIKKLKDEFKKKKKHVHEKNATLERGGKYNNMK